MSRRSLLLYGIGAVVIYLATIMLNVNIATLGYLSVTDALIMIMASSFKPGYAALMGAVPAVLATFTLHYGRYALVIFLIKGLEGWLIAFSAARHQKPWIYTLAVGAMVLVGDGIADALLYGSWNMFTISIGYHAIEVALCTIVALLICPLWNKVCEKFLDD